MAYLDPASNPGSKPQRFSVKNCKTSTPDKVQRIKTIFGISCKLPTKNSIYLHEKTLFVLFPSATAAILGGTFSKRNHRTFQENKGKNH